jgi:hypothetical protein
MKNYIVIIISFVLILFIVLLMAYTNIIFSKNNDDKKQNETNKNNSELLINYKTALEIFDIDVIATATDIETGISFLVQRIGGVTHADVETVSADDTEKLKSIYDGGWSLRRRAIILDIEGKKIAASISAMPHFGREDAPYGAYVDNRSGGTGSGINFNRNRENNMNGVVDIYFYNSLIPGLNKIDERHQEMVIHASKSSI